MIRVLIPLLVLCGSFLWLIWFVLSDHLPSKKQLDAENRRYLNLIKVLYSAAEAAEPFEPILSDTILKEIRSNDPFKNDPNYKELK